MAFKNREDEREYQKRYREENKNELLADARERSKIYYAENKEHKAVIQKAARDADPKKFKDRVRKSRLKYSARVMVRDAKNRAAKKRLPFELTNLDTENLQAIIDAGTCQISGLPFAKGMRFRDPRSPSIDRIEPELGYVPGNIRIVLWAVNAGMATWGFDEYFVIARAIVDKVSTKP